MMKHKRLKLPAFLILLFICTLALIVPAAASTSAVTTVNGTLPLIISDVQVSLVTTNSANI